MSRATMRVELAATLAQVGVSATPGANVESLVRAASTWILAHQRTLNAMLTREAEWRIQARDALVRAGRDPGAHASLDDMIAELCAIADGKVVL